MKVSLFIKYIIYLCTHTHRERERERERETVIEENSVPRRGEGREREERGRVKMVERGKERHGSERGI
jgi:hypothetical protein